MISKKQIYDDINNLENTFAKIYNKKKNGMNDLSDFGYVCRNKCSSCQNTNCEGRIAISCLDDSYLLKKPSFTFLEQIVIFIYVFLFYLLYELISLQNETEDEKK